LSLTTCRQIGSALAIHAPAKLNLFLEILAKRPDGFHDIETLMVCLNIHDTLVFRPRDDGRIVLRCRESRAAPRTFETVPEGPENLVVRAAELLKLEAGTSQGVEIELRKRIPSAAGLAGGSSDAAATFIALNQFWNLKLSSESLFELGARLGSDLGFFLSGYSAAVCRGRGELVTPVRLPSSLPFVLARPSSGLSTAAVYRNCTPAARPQSAEGLVSALRRGEISKAAQLLHNQLQPAAENLNPDVALTRHMFDRLPLLGHQMSGSGTAYFGICAGWRQARQAAARLRTVMGPGAWVAASQSNS